MSTDETPTSLQKTKNVKQSQFCINPSCGKKTNLKIAPYFVCSYFGISLEKNFNRRVCPECFQEAEENRNELAKLLKNKQNIFLAPKKPIVNTVVLDEEEACEEMNENTEEIEVDEDIDEFVKNVMEEYSFDEQTKVAVEHLEKRCSVVESKISELDQLQADLEKTLEIFRKELYENHKPQVKSVEGIDIDTLGNVSRIPINVSQSATAAAESSVSNQLPPIGTYIYKPITVNQSVYAMRSSLLAPWGKGHVIRIKDEQETIYVIRFDSGGKPRSFTLKNLAYTETSPVQLIVGSRVIAQYIEEKDGRFKPSYYAGVVAEPPKYLNQYRYLIFFDDGYAQYCTHQQVMVICHCSRDVWQDIHLNSRPFIANYLQQYPERAMVKLQRGQVVKTELNGRWLIGRVEAVDASLANIFFVSENRYEWIYRGSTRLYPLFELLANAEARKNQGATRPTHNLANMHKKKNSPYVEYTRGLDVEPQPPIQQQPSNVVRAVARKSTSKSNKVFTPPAQQPEDSYTSAEHKGKLSQRKYENYKDVVFEPHQCGKKCTESHPYEEGRFKGCNPLSIPMSCGWSREVVKQKLGGRRTIIYRAPCGRRMRNMEELHRYLRLTGCQLSVDLFCFDCYVHCFTEFEPDVVYSKIKDITYGKENVPVSCVNSIDRSNPEYVHYSTLRHPRDGVNLNLDPDFLVCCDCTDDCQDKDKCACWQLTIQATACGSSGKIDRNVGYQYRRLLQNVVTGVYECNSQCSCRKTCLNRVAQRPLQLRLQVFKTEKRGWGIRCLDDIPKGGFICVYAGQLLTEQGANEDGQQFGDEYLAELDHIEVMERMKEGYESDVQFDDGELSDSSQGFSSDDNSRVSIDSGPKIPVSMDLLNAIEKNEPLKDNPPLEIKEKTVVSNMPFRPLRDLYGKGEHCYIMDAKSMGNIGRYLNHSCRPNVFVQNVFVDTQDLRFPWVAFFAHVYIRAGTELTWDYSYDVGSVPGKVLYCSCGAKECRGRLL